MDMLSTPTVWTNGSRLCCDLHSWALGYGGPQNAWRSCPPCKKHRQSWMGKSWYLSKWIKCFFWTLVWLQYSQKKDRDFTEFNMMQGKLTESLQALRPQFMDEGHLAHINELHLQGKKQIFHKTPKRHRQWEAVEMQGNCLVCSWPICPSTGKTHGITQHGAPAHHRGQFVS